MAFKLYSKILYKVSVARERDHLLFHSVHRVKLDFSDSVDKPSQGLTSKFSSLTGEPEELRIQTFQL